MCVSSQVQDRWGGDGAQRGDIVELRRDWNVVHDLAITQTWAGC